MTFFIYPYNSVFQTYNQNLIAKLHGDAPDNISAPSRSLHPQSTRAPAETVLAAARPDMNRQLGGQLRGSNSPKLLATRLKPQTRYNRNAVLLPMASIRNTRLTSSKLDDIQFWMKRISKTAGNRDDGRLAYHRQRFVIDGNERGAVPPDGKRYGIEAG